MTCYMAYPSPQEKPCDIHFYRAIHSIYGSLLDPHSMAIWIRIQNPDPDSGTKKHVKCPKTSKEQQLIGLYIFHMDTWHHNKVLFLFTLGIVFHAYLLSQCCHFCSCMAHLLRCFFLPKLILLLFYKPVFEMPRKL